MRSEPRQESAPARVRARPTWLISRAYARSHRLLNDGFAASGTGVRAYHYRLLAALDEGGPSSQADLARATSVDRSDVVSVLGDLEQGGLIKRATDPTNRRRNIVSLTPAGRKQLRVLDRIVDEVQEKVLEPLSEPQRKQLLSLLRRLGDVG
jgi:MarR family transcriptional regulator, lower aerobic nicotinate degradation pathway regulator